MKIITALIALSLSMTASADEFEKHPTPVEAITCKNLDFNSNFRAERSKEGILKANPERSKPNFAGKYLLLKNELMLETEWMIADCSSGKFFKERMYGRAEFKPNSALVILYPDVSKNKNNDDQEEALPELKLWKNEQWSTVNVQASIQSNPSKANPTQEPTTQPVSTSEKAVKTLQEHEELFKKFPTTVENITCKKIDYRSHFKAQNSQSTIERENSNLTQPNFSGKYLIVKAPHLFETSWYLIDCTTGKFAPEPLVADHLNFKRDSNLVIISTGKNPKLMTLVDQQWKHVPNPLLEKTKKESNTIYGEAASTLMSALPNPNKKSMLTFEVLQCAKINNEDSCTVDTDQAKAQKVATDKIPQTVSLLNKWGNQQKVSNGRCSSERKPVTCTFEIE